MSSFGRRFVRNTGRAATLAVKTFCLVHLINEHVVEVRACAGASMLPTLSIQGDFVMNIPLSLHRLIHGTRAPPSIGGSSFSKMDPAQGTGLAVGDLVVAISPLDPKRTVCKRVLGLPGDTVAVDPRLRAIPETAWRARSHTLSPSPSPSESGSGSGSGSGFGPQPTQKPEVDVDPDVDVSESTDTDSSPLQHEYIRSTGDVQYITIPSGHVWLAGDNLGNSTDSRHYGPVPMGLIRGKVVARVFPNPTWLSNNLEIVG